MTLTETLDIYRDYTGDWPVLLADAKSYLKVDTTADDALIASIIDNASRYGQRISGLQLNSVVNYVWQVRVKADSLQARFKLPSGGAVVSALSLEKWNGSAFAAVAAADFERFGNELTIDMTDREDVFRISWAGSVADQEPFVLPVLKVAGDMYTNRQEQIEAGLTEVQLNATRLFSTMQDGGGWM
jgi:hypothetical protein